MLLFVPVAGVNTMVRLADLTASWWTPVCVALFVLAGVGLIIVGVGRYPQYLRSATVFGAVVQLLVVSLWFPARTGVLSPPDSINPLWVAGAATVLAVGLVTAYNYAVAIGYVAALLAATAIAYSLAHSGQVLIPIEGLRAIVSGAVVGVFLAVIRAAMATARRVDDERARALDTAATEAGRAARALERRRMDSVVRDEVIAVLRTMRGGTPERVQRDQALSALAVLDGTEAERASHLTPDQAFRRLRQSVIDYGDHIAVELDVDRNAGDYPAPAVEAVIGATGEAVANSLRHAGAHASQIVVGQLSVDGIRVRVVDNGEGFNPERVPGDRMGIEVGIRQRMGTLPGGACAIESARGDGTMVSLEWRRR